MADAKGHTARAAAGTALGAWWTVKKSDPRLDRLSTGLVKGMFLGGAAVMLGPEVLRKRPIGEQSSSSAGSKLPPALQLELKSNIYVRNGRSAGSG